MKTAVIISTILVAGLGLASAGSGIRGDMKKKREDIDKAFEHAIRHLVDMNGTPPTPICESDPGADIPELNEESEAWPTELQPVYNTTLKCDIMRHEMYELGGVDTDYYYFSKILKWGHYEIDCEKECPIPSCCKVLKTDFIQK